MGQGNVKPTIWCLFSVDNNYDQPNNNLVAWWMFKPSFEVLLKSIGGSFTNEKSILAAANIMQGKESRLYETDYRLEVVAEGLVVTPEVKGAFGS